MIQENSNKRKTIIFDQVKKPLFTIKDGYRVLDRRLRTSGYKVISNDKEITDEILSQASIYVIIAPQMLFTNDEFNCLKNFTEKSGILWIFLHKGGEKELGTNINFLLEQYGISVNNDSVIRQSYYKYFHPKEVLISNGILNRSLMHIASRLRNQTINNNKSNQDSYEGEDDLESRNRFNFLFTNGATINVERPAIALLSTGTVSFPINRPVCSLYNKSNGKIIVLGSSEMFTDKYIEKEDNALLFQIIVQYSIENDIQLNAIDADNPEISEYHSIPNISLLADQPMPYFEESEKIPSDFTKLIFENHRNSSSSGQIHPNEFKELFQFDNSVYPLILGCYNEFHLEHEPLTLIKPAFQTPLPPLEPAVFSPRFRGLPKPILELYDLDEEFCTVPARLQQLANKCSDQDLDYFIQECGRLLGILDANTRTSKEILERTFKKIIQYKKVNLV